MISHFISRDKFADQNSTIRVKHFNVSIESSTNGNFIFLFFSNKKN